MELFGTTRTHLAARHALITDDGHVPSTFPGWKGATAFVHISPAMGARMTQMTVIFDEEAGTAMFRASDHEHFIYVEMGTIVWNGRDFPAGDFIFAPSGTKVVITGGIRSRITVFRKIFEALPRRKKPEVVMGSAGNVSGEPFLGNTKARLQTLLPISDSFDMAVNIFTYQSGATLPFVETHIMEHGLKMLSGQGLYRLEEKYYPVRSGDVIWMAAYCPQWFVAIGDGSASYIYFKDVNRLP